MYFDSYNKMNMFDPSQMITGGGSYCGTNNSLAMLFQGTGSPFDISGSNFIGQILNNSCSQSPFVDYKGRTNTNALAGCQVGMVLLNIASKIVDQVVSERSANSKNSVKQDVNDLQGMINDKLDTLGEDVYEDNYTSFNVKEQDWYTSELKTIKKDQLDNKSLDGHKATIKKYDDLVKLKAGKTGQELESIEKQIEDNKAAYNTAKEAIEKHNAAIDAEKKLNEDAAKKQKTANKTIEEITDLIDKRNNAQSKVDEKTLDKLDGTTLNRISEENYREKIKTNEKDEVIITDDATFAEKDLRRAIYNFRKATSDNDKQKYKKEFLAIWNSDKLDNKTKEDMRDAFTVIDDYSPKKNKSFGL